ncbi:MAG: sulfatase-like hydrolase/transferase, partial [Deltaproteobacteria bacterium]
EAFLDHNLFLHKELYRPVLRVPLLVHRPWAPQPRASGERVSLMDLAPTILDLAGVPRPAQLAAGGLPRGDAAATPGGDPDPEFAYYRSRRNYYYEAWALRDGPWTLIHHRMGRGQPFSTEIYDARVDPSERSPVRDQPEREREMLARLESWRERAPQSNAPDIELDAETVEHLRALGYAN